MYTPTLNIIDQRARAKITSHFGISSSGHFWQILKSKNLEIVHYYCAFCSSKSTKPNLNLSAKNVNLFLREPSEIARKILMNIERRRMMSLRSSVYKLVVWKKGHKPL